MILVIDDDPRRIAGFREALGKIVWANSAITAAAALTLYQNGELTTIYLDYDGVIGEYLAKRIAARGLHRSAKIIIHSSNYAGAIEMRDILKPTHDVELKSYAEIVGEPNEE